MKNFLLLSLSLLAFVDLAQARNTPTDTVQMYTQGSAPGSPLAGSVYKYFLTSDGFPYWKHSGGSVFGYLYSSSALTQYGVLVGAGTRAPGVLTPASDNTVLVGNTGANPSFRQILNADIDSATDISASKIQEANGASNGGVLTTAAQDIGGEKRFLDAVGLKHVSTPSNPSAGYMKVYCKSDDKCYKLTSGGAESELGGGGGGGFNMAILDTAANNWAATKQANSDFEASVGDWVAFADAATATPSGDLTGGSPNTTCARDTSGEINGTASLLVTVSSGASRQGEGCSVVINIPTAYRGKPIRVSFPYTTTGTIAAGDFIAYAYDVTNTSLLAPSATITALTGSSGIGHWQFVSQTSTAQLRIGLYIARTSTGAATITLDDLRIEPDPAQANEPLSDLVAFTPTLSAGFGTPTNVEAFSQRMGDRLFVRGSFTTGTVAASLATITLPYGLLLDTTKIGLANTSANPGPIMGYATSSGGHVPIVSSTGTSSTLLYFGGGSSSAPQNGSASFSNSQVITFWFSVPISGWSSGGGSSPLIELSDSADLTVTPNAFGTVSNNRWKFRRVGEQMHVYGYFTAGTVAGTTASLDIGGGYKIDSSKLGTTINMPLNGACFELIGTGAFRNGESNVLAYPFFDGSDTDTVFLAVASGSSTTFEKTVGTSMQGNGGGMSCYFSFPVSGWTSTSSGTLTAPRSYVRVGTGNGHGSTNTKIRRFTTTHESVGSAITYADSAANGASFTINEAGIYAISYSDNYSASAAGIGISKNSTQLTTNAGSVNLANLLNYWAVGTAYVQTGSWTGYLAVGDVIRPHTHGTVDTVDPASTIV